MANMFKKDDIKTFDLSDLVGRSLIIKNFKEGYLESIYAIDINSGELFLLKITDHINSDLEG